MGQDSSKKNIELFTEYEFDRLADTFHLNKDDLSTVTGDTFRAKWSHFMVQSLMETWIQYFIRNEFHYQFRATFDLERFSHLYKDQSSPFIDVKARGIIKIILGTDFSDRILGVNHARVVEYFRDVIISYMKCLEHDKNFQFMKWKELGCSQYDHHQKQMVYHFVSDLASSQGKVSEMDLESWLREKNFIDDVLENLLDMSFSFHEFDEEFHPLLPIPIATTNTLLDLSHVLFLTAYLTRDLKKSWSLVYSTKVNGHNFTLLSAAVREVGPTILVVKESKGNLFGGFASDAWRPSPQFYGDSRCFVFQLTPNILIFEATGLNTNFMYHNVNQQTLANGFGMGGQLGFWGLWIDSDFGNGRCETYCSTFKNYHRLSKKTEFIFDDLEVWAVDHESVTSKATRDKEAVTILESDPAALAMLQMTSKVKVQDLQ